MPRLRELADAEASARMRAILHHPAFQALESAWRAVFHLVRATETGSQLQIYLLDVSKAELAADLSAADDLRKSRTWRMLVEETGAGEDRWSVVAGNYSFAQTVGDAEMLGRLAKIMSYAGAPFLGEADPGNSGTDAEEGTRHWERLRQLPEAGWIGLAMPRFLLRLPYGKKTDGVESFDFEEMPGVPAHREYLWGNPAFACVQVLAEAFANDGWEMRPGAGAEIEGLPLHVYEAEGEKQVKPCAEVLLTEREIEWILDRGYMALASNPRSGRGAAGAISIDRKASGTVIGPLGISAGLPRCRSHHRTPGCLARGRGRSIAARAKYVTSTTPTLYQQSNRREVPCHLWGQLHL